MEKRTRLMFTTCAYYLISSSREKPGKLRCPSEAGPGLQKRILVQIIPTPAKCIKQKNIKALRSKWLIIVMRLSCL